MEREDESPLSANVAQKLKSVVRWMTHEDRPYEPHDYFLATLTRERYLKFRHMDALSFSVSSPSHHEPYKHQVKKGPQRKAFFSQQEEISDVEKSVFSIWVDLFLCRSIQLLVLS